MIKMTYQVPLKVDEIVRRDKREIKRRLTLAAQGPQECPLQGYIGHEKTSLIIDEADHLESMIGPACGWTGSRPIVRKGWYALRDEICYLNRGSRKQPQISCMEECPVYQRVNQLLETTPIH